MEMMQLNERKYALVLVSNLHCQRSGEQIACRTEAVPKIAKIQSNDNQEHVAAAGIIINKVRVRQGRAWQNSM